METREEVFVAETAASQEESKEGTLSRVARLALYALFALLPVLFISGTALTTDAVKFLLVSVCTLLALVATVGAGLQEGRLYVPRSAALYAFGALALVLFVTGLLASDVTRAMFGELGDIRTAFALALALVLFALIPSVYHRPEHVVRAMTVFAVGALLGLALMLARNVLGIPLGFPKTFSVVGSWNAYGFFAGTMLLFSLPLLSLPRTSLFWKLGAVIAVSSFVIVALVNYSLVWVGIGLLALILLALYFSSGKRKTSAVTLTFLLIIASVLFFLLESPMGSISGAIGGTPEIAPSWAGTGAIAERVIAEEPFTGVGLNNFAYAWEKYRPASISDTAFWRARFEGGVGLMPSFAVEGGLVVVIAILAFLVFAVGRSIRDVIRAVYLEGGSWEEALTIGLFSASVFTLFEWVLYPSNTFLFFFGVIVLGLATALSELHRAEESRVIELFGNAAKGFVASLALILLAVLAVGGMYSVVMRGAADFAFRTALAEYNEKGESNNARIQIERAIALYGNNAAYYRAVTDLERVRITNITAKEDVRKENVQASIQEAISRGIQYGNKAIELSRADSENWRSLGMLYATVIPLVDGAGSKATEEYSGARDRSPRDPLLLTEFAQVHIAQAELARRSNDAAKTQSEINAAIQLLEEATTVKRDYASAHFLLAQLYSANGKEKEALARAVAAYQLAPKEVGVAFQLGVLAYRAKDYRTARTALEKALSINENYSNARYFLGLVLADQGSTADAIAAFEKVLALNVGNKEIETILANLRAGKPALTGITPPPTERKEPPVSEKAPATQ